MTKEWQKAPPKVGDFSGSMAIYLVRGGQLNYPIPAQVYVATSCRRGIAGKSLVFEFLCDGLHGLMIRADTLSACGMLQGVEWYGPVDYPE